MVSKSLLEATLAKRSISLLKHMHVFSYMKLSYLGKKYAPFWMDSIYFSLFLVTCFVPLKYFGEFRQFTSFQAIMNTLFFPVAIKDLP